MNKTPFQILDELQELVMISDLLEEEISEIHEEEITDIQYVENHDGTATITHVNSEGTIAEHNIVITENQSSGITANVVNVETNLELHPEIRIFARILFRTYLDSPEKIQLNHKCTFTIEGTKLEFWRCNSEEDRRLYLPKEIYFNKHELLLLQPVYEMVDRQLEIRLNKKLQQEFHEILEETEKAYLIAFDSVPGKQDLWVAKSQCSTPDENKNEIMMTPYIYDKLFN